MIWRRERRARARLAPEVGRHRHLRVFFFPVLAPACSSSSVRRRGGPRRFDPLAFLLGGVGAGAAFVVIGFTRRLVGRVTPTPTQPRLGKVAARRGLLTSSA